MAGTPEKMLEHLLETRMDGRAIIGGKDLNQTPHADHFVDDFLLTYVVFMTTEELVNELSRQYPFITKISGLVLLMLARYACFMQILLY